MWGKVFAGILAYVKDWKNLAVHALIGVAILMIAIYLPVDPYARAGILVCVIGANVTRMRVEKKKRSS